MTLCATLAKKKHGAASEIEVCGERFPPGNAPEPAHLLVGWVVLYQNSTCGTRESTFWLQKKHFKQNSKLERSKLARNRRFLIDIRRAHIFVVDRYIEDVVRGEDVPEDHVCRAEDAHDH